MDHLRAPSRSAQDDKFFGVGRDASRDRGCPESRIDIRRKSVLVYVSVPPPRLWVEIYLLQKVREGERLQIFPGIGLRRKNLSGKDLGAFLGVSLRFDPTWWAERQLNGCVSRREVEDAESGLLFPSSRIAN
jgi:hypothetical protein